MHKNAFGGRARLDPLGELSLQRSPDSQAGLKGDDMEGWWRERGKDPQCVKSVDLSGTHCEIAITRDICTIAPDVQTAS